MSRYYISHGGNIKWVSFAKTLQEAQADAAGKFRTHGRTSIHVWTQECLGDRYIEVSRAWQGDEPAKLEWRVPE